MQPPLEKLHAAAKGDRWRFIGLIPSFLVGSFQRKSFMEMISSDAMKECSIPISTIYLG